MRKLAVCLCVMIMGRTVLTGATFGQSVEWGSSYFPQLIVQSELTNVISVAGGDTYRLALKNDGTVVAWGYEATWYPATVPPGLSNVVAIAAGDIHRLALRNDGRVIAWRARALVQSNVFANVTNAVAIAAGYGHELVLKSDGTVAAWGEFAYWGQANVPAGLSNVVAIAAGEYHSLALKSDGTVVGWGDDLYGKATVPADLTNVVAIAAGKDHSLALKADNTLVAWGDTLGNATAVPMNLTNVSAIASGEYHGLALLDDGTVRTWGSDTSGLATVPTEVTNVIAIAGGSSARYSLAVLGDGSITILRQPISRAAYSGMEIHLNIGAAGAPRLGYQWQHNGTNIDGANQATLKLTGLQLADAGNYSVIVSNLHGIRASSNATLTVTHSLPIIVAQPMGQVGLLGSNVTLTAKVEGSWPLSYQWQFNGTNILAATNASLNLPNVGFQQEGQYQLLVSNLYGSMISSNVFVDVVDLPEALNNTNLVWVTDGGGAWVAQTRISHDGVAAAECNGILEGQDSTLSATVSGPGTLSFWWVISSYSHLDHVSFWLDGVEQARIAAWTPWQEQTYHLGTGSHTLQWKYTKGSPTDSGYNTSWLDEVGYLAGPATPIVTEHPVDVIQAAGSLAIFRVSAVGTPPLSYQWQFNGVDLPGANSATLTLTNVQTRNHGSYRVVVSNDYGTIASSNATLSVVPKLVVAWGGVSYSLSNELSSLTNVLAIAAGSSHILMLTDNGTVVARGDNSYNQINVPTNLSNVVAIAAGYNHSLALRSNGTVTSWGGYPPGFPPVLASPLGLSNVVAIAAGNSFSLALKSDGVVVAWGNNYVGATNLPPGLSNVVAIAAGYSQALALKGDGTVVGWPQSYYPEGNVPVGLSNVVAIAQGYSHSLALKDEGVVVAWGTSYQGMGVPVTPPEGLSNVVAITAGGYYFGDHSVALRNDGSVVVWGANDYGQTNIPPNLTNDLVVAAGSTYSLVLVGTNSPVIRASMTDADHCGANRFSAAIPTRSGKVYRLEYKNSLTDADWIALPLVAGTGSNLTLVDPTANSSQRFYRARQW